jgi:hypothetical protein
LVKWKELGYDEATWEVEEDVAAFQAEIEKFKEIMSRPAMRKRKGAVLDNKDLKRRRKDFKPFKKTPKFLVGGMCSLGILYHLIVCIFLCSKLPDCYGCIWMVLMLTPRSFFNLIASRTHNYEMVDIRQD